jgi:hypothetical protein
MKLSALDMKAPALGNNHQMYRHLALFTNNHVARTNHKHALIFLKPMGYEHRILRSHKFSVTQ